jgi:hypothetical protein
MKNLKRMERCETTFGELVAALCTAAFQVCKEEKRAYRLAGLALEDLMARYHIALGHWRPPTPVLVLVRTRSFRESRTSIR